MMVGLVIRTSCNNPDRLLVYRCETLEGEERAEALRQRHGARGIEQRRRELLELSIRDT
jgi:hypothetical protein